MNQELITVPKINKYIDTFKSYLYQLILTSKKENNIVLAGTLALGLHGLEMSREAGDLDVVIFDPTEAQLDFIDIIKESQVEKPYLRPSDFQRSYKFEKNGLCIDFILAKGLQKPLNLLFYNYGGVFWEIQNIKLNIEAKLGYDRYKGGDRFIRSKDAEGLIDLKNSNFNLR